MITWSLEVIHFLCFLIANLAFWNIRGLHEPNKQFALHRFLRVNKISLVGVLETKVRDVDKQKSILAAFSGWKCLTNLCESHNGCVWVLWRDNLNVVCLKKSNHLIHCQVTVVDSGLQFRATLVYAANMPAEREPLWQDIRDLATQIQSPWIVMGDLNSTLLHDERLKNGVIVDSDTTELQSLSFDTGLLDLRYSGVRLTWCNNHMDQSRLYCKLDRAMVNSLWSDTFYTSEAIFLPSGISDHSPCVVRMINHCTQGKYMFKFCDFWTTDPRFNDLIKEAWSEDVVGTPMFVLTQKLKL